ncbi:MAG TPA: nicotinamide riboside transporter PnuC [Draconibacterium sp.]|jgi:nicotinamide mononucleotide transporter|nr:nicotinamide riboside transporter PnuC [Draconibacterium sp.]
MLHSITEWLLSNKIELLGAILGILYVVLSIRQNIFTWPTGLLTSVLYIVVFYKSALYAAMSLQVYYVFISIYGWYFWLRGKNSNNKLQARVQKINKQFLLRIGAVTLLIYGFILFILINFSDSDVPFMDSLTTSLSITATWMLARKYIEHWIIWIFVDIVSSGLYIYKNLWPTVVLFLVYTVMAFIGYVEWKKDLKSEN